VTQFIVKSQWPIPGPNAWERNFDYNIERFARWLNSAGAEPRLALVLCSNAQAKSRLIDGLSSYSIDPQFATTSSQRPLAEAVVKHQGTHFNNKLFLVDGFDACDMRDVCGILEGQRSVLRRSATWVALIIESAEALAMLYHKAPMLTASIMRRFLFISPEDTRCDQPVAPAAQINQWNRQGLISEQVFHTVCTGGSVADYTQYARLFRSGYGTALSDVTDASWGSWFEEWYQRDLSAISDASVPLASGIARHRLDLGETERRQLTDRLLSRPICRVAAGLDPRSQADHVYRVSQSADAEDTLGDDWQNGVRSAMQAWLKLPGGAACMELAIAEGCALNDDVDGCLTALENALGHADKPGTPELHFEVMTTRLRLQVLLSQRTLARQSLDVLETLAIGLESPFYQAKSLLARGDYRLPLDKSPARDDYRAAERMFRVHGYPDWAATVADRLKMP
jgi:hypothetical protein